MNAGERTYGRNELIFREGDPSDAAYVVVSGRVELSKLGPDGPVLLAMLGPTEMFGEMGLFDDAPRSASARAAEKTRVKIIAREEFKNWLQDEPGAALRVVGMLVERLRMADAIIAGQQGSQSYTPPTARRNPFGVMLAWLRRLRRPTAESDGSLSIKPLIIGVATVNNDIEGAWTRALAGLLEGRQGIAVRSLPAALQLEPGADQAQINAVAVKARQMLAKDETLDLLIWGDVHADGFSLWFSANGVVDEDRPGGFSLYLKLELAGDLEPPVGDLLYLAVLAAIEPANDDQRNLQRRLLPQAEAALPGFVGGLPVAWNLEQQRSALTCYGHAAATIAVLEGDAQWHARAAEAYGAAILRLGQSEHGLEEAQLRKHMGGVLQAAADRNQSPELLEQAVGEFRASAECLVKSVYPQEWGGAQNRLGLALYKLDLLTGRTDLLKEAMSAFQAALQVFTRMEAPQRWADVMNNLAGALQVYGDQVKSAEVLERAIDACRAALEFRPRSRTPLGWAASQNTLGTALFLLDKHSKTTEHLDEAVGCFTGALEVYRQFGLVRQAAVAEKNLAHVQRLNKARGERKVAMPDWADREGR